MSTTSENLFVCVRCGKRKEEVCLVSDTPFTQHAYDKGCPDGRFGSPDVPEPMFQVVQLTLPPVPFERWPWIVVCLHDIRAPEDEGAGDTIYRVLGVAGLLYASIHKLVTGSGCGCAKKRTQLNYLYQFK